MLRRRVRLGFIGCGGHARGTLYPCLPHIEEVELVAVCDLDPERARQTAERFGAKRWYTDMERMLAGEELDAVVICGPPQLHTEAGIRCLEAGLHVFVEKPPSVNYLESMRFLEAARKAGRNVMVGFMKRFYTSYRLAKKLSQSPEFGGVRMVSVKFANGQYPSIWGIETPEQSFLVGQAVHMFDLIRFFGGEVSEVHAKLHRASEGRFGYAVLVEFKSGAVGTMNLNALQSWEGLDEWLSLTGEGSYILVVKGYDLRFFPGQQWGALDERMVYGLYQGWSPPGSMPAVDNHSYTLQGYLPELREFARAILEGRPPSPDIEDGHKALLLAEAVWRSATEGRPVSLSEIEGR